MWLSIVLCFCLSLIVFLLWSKRRATEGNRLPGPIPVPILGNLLQVGNRPYVKFTQWAKCYGPIYGIKIGFTDAVFVNDYKYIKELFNETASTGRMADNSVMTEFTKGPYGILNSSGSNWEEQRKFTLRILRNFGFSKTSMESLILEEVQIMLDWLRIREGYPISCTKIFTAPVINSLWRIVSGERCQWENGKCAIVDAADNFFKELMNVSSNGLLFAPVLRFIVPSLFGWSQYVQSINTISKLFEESISRHVETFDSGEIRDFIDQYLLELAKSTDPNSSFYKETGTANMTAGIFDLFVGGSETTSTQLTWAILYLSEYQNIQIGMQNEIDEVIGSTLPSLSDRVNLPYCEAVILEILRMTPVAPIGPAHGMISDMVFYGYKLLAGTTVFPNIYAVHHDPEIWGDPEIFRPERFLNEDKTKCIRNNALIPFSEGKRKCIGDTFAMDTLFLFVISICQHFNILPDKDNKQNHKFEPLPGFMLIPKPFKIVVSSRK